MQLGVAAGAGDELVVGAAFDDAPGFEDEDDVGVADGGEPVGDDDGGAAFEGLVEGGLDGGLGGVVQGGGGFVEDDDAGLGEQQPGDGEALAFPAGEAVAALPDDGVEAVGQVGDEVGEAGAAQGVEDLLVVGGGAGQAQVGAQRLVEEVPVLGDDADGLAQGGGGEVADVGAADADGAGVDVVEAGQELGEGGLAGAGGADDGDDLAGVDAEGDVVDDLDAAAGVEGGDLLEGGEGDVGGGGVGEADGVELDGDGAGGLGRAPGRSRTRGTRSRISKTRSKLTRALITSTRALASAVSGA